jgi:hypothetical protein
MIHTNVYTHHQAPLTPPLVTRMELWPARCMIYTNVYTHHQAPLTRPLVTLMELWPAHCMFHTNVYTHHQARLPRPLVTLMELWPEQTNFDEFSELVKYLHCTINVISISYLNLANSVPEKTHVIKTLLTNSLMSFHTH